MSSNRSTVASSTGNEPLQTVFVPPDTQSIRNFAHLFFRSYLNTEDNELWLEVYEGFVTFMIVVASIVAEYKSNIKDSNTQAA